MKPEVGDLCQSVVGEQFDRAIHESMKGWAEATHKHPHSGAAINYFKDKMSAAFKDAVAKSFERIIADVPLVARQPYEQFWNATKELIMGRATPGMNSVKATMIERARGLLPNPHAILSMFGQEEAQMHGMIHRLYTQALNKDKITLIHPPIVNAAARSLNFGSLDMGDFSSLMTSTVCVVKTNGQRIPNIKASVQKNKIFVMDGSILIEAGDRVETTASNGAFSAYEVIEPGFHEGMAGIEAHYQMEVRRVGAKDPRTGQVINNNTINVGTAHGPIQQGTHNSTQVSHISDSFKNDAQALVDQLQELVKNVTDQSSRQDMSSDLRTIEAQLLSSKPKTSIVKESLHSMRAIAEGVGAGAIVEITKVFLTAHGLL